MRVTSSGGTHRRDNPRHDELRVLMLPRPKHTPPRECEAHVRIAVSVNIALNLVAPPFSVVLGPSHVLRTPVPEATINEDRDASARESYIGATTEAGQWVVDAESQTRTVQSGPNRKLRRRVAPPLRPHSPQSVGRGSDRPGHCHDSDPPERRVVLVGDTRDHRLVVIDVSRLRRRRSSHNRYGRAVVRAVDTDDR